MTFSVWPDWPQWSCPATTQPSGGELPPLLGRSSRGTKRRKGVRGASWKQPESRHWPCPRFTEVQGEPCHFSEPLSPHL